MDSLTFLLTGPGRLLADLLLPTPAWPEDGEAHADLVVTLGIAFCLLTALVLRLTWALARRSGRQAPSRDLRAGAMAAPAGAVRALRLPPWRLIWGWVWRAQAAHMLIYAGVPLLWEAARWALLIVTAPLWIVGPGSGPGVTDGTLAHWRQPACWTFVTLCPGPHSHFLHTPVIQASRCVGGVCPPGDRRLPDTGGWLAKGLWAALALAWILNGRRSAPAAGPPRSGAR